MVTNQNMENRRTSLFLCLSEILKIQSCIRLIIKMCIKRGFVFSQKIYILSHFILKINQLTEIVN